MVHFRLANASARRLSFARYAIFSQMISSSGSVADPTPIPTARAWNFLDALSSKPDFSFRDDLRKFQSQCITEKKHRALQVLHRQVCFEKIANRNHRIPPRLKLPSIVAFRS